MPLSPSIITIVVVAFSVGFMLPLAFGEWFDEDVSSEFGDDVAFQTMRGFQGT
jgi:hypothetical protein